MANFEDLEKTKYRVPHHEAGYGPIFDVDIYHDSKTLMHGISLRVPPEMYWDAGSYGGSGILTVSLPELFEQLLGEHAEHDAHCHLYKLSNLLREYADKFESAAREIGQDS